MSYGDAEQRGEDDGSYNRANENRVGTVAAKQSEMSRVQEMARLEADKMMELISILEKRLDQVLSPEEERADKEPGSLEKAKAAASLAGADSMRYRTALALSHADIVNQQRTNRRRIEKILDRLEV